MGEAKKNEIVILGILVWSICLFFLKKKMLFQNDLFKSLYSNVLM